jgi:hypothetical protein
MALERPRNDWIPSFRSFTSSVKKTRRTEPSMQETDRLSDRCLRTSPGASEEIQGIRRGIIGAKWNPTNIRKFNSLIRSGLCAFHFIHPFAMPTIDRMAGHVVDACRLRGAQNGTATAGDLSCDLREYASGVEPPSSRFL